VRRDRLGTCAIRHDRVGARIIHFHAGSNLLQVVGGQRRPARRSTAIRGILLAMVLCLRFRWHCVTAQAGAKKIASHHTQIICDALTLIRRPVV